MEHQRFKCRFCLTNEGQSVNLFDHYVSDKKICFGLVASQLFDLKITKGDGISGEICVQCFLKTYDYYYFKLKCQESEHILKESHSERKKEVNLNTNPASTLDIQEIPQQDSDLKEKPESSSRKRKVDASREETSVLTKKLNSVDESLRSDSHVTSLENHMKCKSCSQFFPSPELIHHVLQHIKDEKTAEIEANSSPELIHHVLQHIKDEKTAEIEANSSPEENVCKDIDWEYENVKAKNRCDPLLVKSEVPKSDCVHPPLSIKREAEPLEDDVDDCAIVFVRELTDGEEGRVEKEFREECSVKRNSLLYKVKLEERREMDEYSSQSGKSLLRELMSVNVSGSSDKMETQTMDSEIRMESVIIDSYAEMRHSAEEERLKANNHQLKVVDVKSMWLGKTNVGRNLSKCISKREHNQNNLSNHKPERIEKSSNAFENAEIETVLDKRTCNGSVTEREVFQQMATMKGSCKTAGIVIENEIECVTDHENRIDGPDRNGIERDPNFISSNGKPERCESVRNRLPHSNNSIQKVDISSGYRYSLDTLQNKLHNDSEVNYIKERPPQQAFHAEGKSLTLTNNTTHDCGPDSPFSFTCSLCRDSFSSHSHLLKHLSAHKKCDTLGTGINFSIKQKSEEQCKVSADEGKEEHLHRTSMMGVNERRRFGNDRIVESNKKLQISALSHLKTMVCGSEKDKSLLRECSDSPKKLSLESNPPKSTRDLSQRNPSGKTLVCEKKDGSVKKFDCWLCVQTFPTARLLLDHSYVHFEYSETNMIYSSSHSDVLVNSSSNGSQKHRITKSPCSNYSPSTTSPFRYNGIALASGIPDGQLIEGEKLLRKKLRIDDLNGESGVSFRCPACLKKFSEWSIIVQHIVRFHENLSEDWPMKVLFLPLLKQGKILEKNPLGNFKKSVKNEENRLHIMRSLLCGLRCEFCYKPFHSERALLKHKVWAHPDNI